jgi:hypothetical protein
MSKRRNANWQREIIINGFWNVDALQLLKDEIYSKQTLIAPPEASDNAIVEVAV